MYNVVLCLLLLTSVTRTEALTNAELTYEIFEELASKTYIGNIANDLKLLESVTDIKNLKFSLLTKGNTDSLLFTTDETTGDLMTSQLIDRESICGFMLTCELNFEVVVQSNLGSFFRKIAVSVTILDINDNSPKFTPDTWQVTISEGSGIGTTFPIVKAIDQDTDVNNSVHSYELVTLSDKFSLVTERDLFTGDFSKVSLKVERKLDREIEPSYELIVVARDNANPPKSGTLLLTVVVGDINDNEPEFEQTSHFLNVSESLPLNGLILKLNATDKDTGDNAKVSYYFSPRQPERVLNLFNLDPVTGELRTAKSLNTSVGEVFEILTEARDNGSPVLTKQVQISIRVLDTHNNPPVVNVNVFSISGSAEVSESSTIGRAVAHIGVDDPDSGLNGIVNCSISHEYITISRLDVNEYKAILSKKLDREHIPQHTATVICYDAGAPPLTSSVEFNVRVLDENDNRPVFSRKVYYASVIENNNIGHFITTVTAVDYDVGSNAEISYSLSGEFMNSFKIYPNGSVIAIRQLDRELNPVIRLQVEASDHGTTSLTSTTIVEIAVGDMNDKRPEFNKTVYYFNVLENLKPGNKVGVVKAFDKDIGKNAELTFSIVKNNPDTPFSCTPEGLIKTTKMLDRETKNRYRFAVKATDFGDDPLSSSVEVVVIVQDLNDQSPVILLPNEENNTMSIPNSFAPHTGFYAILAYDMDTGHNSDLEYYIEGESEEYFTVDPINGEVFTKIAFNVKQVGVYRLKLVVKDRGSPIRSSASDLFVKVYDDGGVADEVSSPMSMQNIIIVTVIVCITIILGLTVGVIIFFLRRRDKQKRIYNAKLEESRVVANMKQYETDSTDSTSCDSRGNLYSQSSSSESVSSNGKKKEVSFSLEEKKNLTGETDAGVTNQNKAAKTMFNQLSQEHLNYKKNKYSGIIEPPFKGLSTYLYHQKPISKIHDKDNASLTSGEVSTTDSGRGGSDVEVSSHTVSHDSGEMFFVQPSRQSFRHKSIRKAPPPTRPPPTYYDNHNYAPSPDVEKQINHNNVAIPTSEQLQGQYNQNSSPAFAHGGSSRFQNRSVPGRYGGKRGVNQENGKKTDDASIYMEMKSPITASFASSSTLDDSKLWVCDNDTTTTSGSYTVDADELCNEIDKLFFKQSDMNGDIIV